LEYSFYLVSDLQGRFIISHPGDYYTSRQSVRVTDQDGNPLLEFGDTGSGLGQFQTPTGVALWRQPCASNPCRFLVADSGNNRIQAFDANGNFVSAYGVPGNGNGQFNNPQGLAITNSGNIIIADSGNNRLQVLSFDGTNFNFVRVITASLNHPTGLAAFEDSILVADTGNSTIKVLNSQGNITAAYTAPTDGRTGTFNQPRGIAVDNDGSIVVADTGNKRVVTILNALPIWKIYLPIVNR
jgi:sugar lactone lactonase YvrE